MYMKYVLVDPVVVNHAGPEGVKSKLSVEHSSGHPWFRRATSPSKHPSRNLVFVIFICTQSIFFCNTIRASFVPVISIFYHPGLPVQLRTYDYFNQSRRHLIYCCCEYLSKPWGLLHSKHSFILFIFVTVLPLPYILLIKYIGNK